MLTVEFCRCISVDGLLIQRNVSVVLSTKNLLIVSLSKVVLSDARQPAVDRLHSWAILLPKFLDSSSLLLVKDMLAFP